MNFKFTARFNLMANTLLAGRYTSPQPLEEMRPFPFTHGTDQRRFPHQVLDVFINISCKPDIAGVYNIYNTMNQKGDHPSVENSQYGIVAQNHFIKIKFEFSEWLTLLICCSIFYTSSIPNSWGESFPLTSIPMLISNSAGRHF